MNQVGIQNALSVTTGAAVALTPSYGTGATRPASHAIIQVNTNSIRWRADGTAPTATIGILVAAGSNIEFMDLGDDFAGVINNFRAIGISGTATLEVAFFGR